MEEKDVESVMNRRLKSMEIEKKLNETCTGISCIKDEMKLMKDEFNLKIQEDRKERDDTQPCPGCGSKELHVGNSFCPSCGVEIESWDEIPNWKRNKRM